MFACIEIIYDFKVRVFIPLFIGILDDFIVWKVFEKSNILDQSRSQNSMIARTTSDVYHSTVLEFNVIISL